MTMSIPIENGSQVGIIVASVFSMFIAALAVSLRLVAKHLISGFDFSDYCMIAALLCNTALHTCCIVLVTYGGFGFHTIDIYSRFGPDTVVFFFKGIMSFALLWNATVCFSKLSVLFMYTALMPIRSMMIWTRSIGALIVAWNVSDIIAGLLICRPLARNWDFTIPGTCGSQPAYYFAMGVINVITDIIILVLPMPYLYHLHMATRKKFMAAGLLGVGIITWVITIYRQTLLPGLDFADMTHSGVLATVLSGLEPAVAIALACVPLLRPLLGRHSRQATTSSYAHSSGIGSVFRSKKSALDESGLFAELGDNNDENQNSSQIQLQPMTPAQDEEYLHHHHMGRNGIRTSTQSLKIKVEKTWEVKQN